MLMLLALLAKPVPVVVWGVQDIGTTPNAVLVDTASERFLLIGISRDQALSLELGLSGKSFQRPLTHDLFITALDSAGWRLKKVVVTALKNDVFYAEIHLSRGKKNMVLDARPSDALCLAVRAGCKVFVEDEVLDEFFNDLRDMFKNAPGERPGVGI